MSGMRCRNWEILLLSEVAFTVSIMVNIRQFARLHSTPWINVALRTVLMLSLMTITEVLKGELSLLIISLCSLRVGSFLVEGALVVVWGGAAAGTGLADGGMVFFLDFFATCAHVVRAGWVVLVLG
jgi:hypothetical protein